jgi:hypothetical protein
MSSIYACADKVRVWLGQDVTGVDDVSQLITRACLRQIQCSAGKQIVEMRKFRGTQTLLKILK